MGDKTFTIFLSSTRRDLGDFRSKAAEALRAAYPDYEVRFMEDAEPEDMPGDHWSRREATKPDLLIGLVGQYYGTVLAGQDHSLTEQEFDVAGTAGVDRRVFFTDGGDPALIAGQDPEAKERVKRFRAKVDDSVFRGKVSTPEEFARKAVDVVKSWERETFRGTTQRYKDYFAPVLGADQLYGHAGPLVGQDDVLAQLRAFAQSDSRLLILHAPWGHGKSRLLLELAKLDEVTLRFVRPGATLSRERLGISAVDPCVLVLEDAPSRSDGELRILFDFLLRCSSAVKLIIALRPSQERRAAALARVAGFAAASTKSITVPVLTDQDQRRLIAGILGEDGELAYRLAVRTRGSALAAVVSARLIKQGKATLAQLEQHENFLGEVLERFQDALVHDAASSPAEERELRGVLQLVALCAPIRPGDESAMEKLAAFLGIQRDSLLSRVERLEDAGLLVRWGGLVTVPVDAIQEIEIVRACVARGGEPTRFVERAFRDLWPGFGAQMLRNLAAAEWRTAQGDEPVSLLERIWPQVVATFHNTPLVGRLVLLPILAEIAPVQAERSLALVRDTMADLSQSTESETPTLAIQEALTRVVRGTWHVPNLVAGVCDILWTLAEDDERPPHQHPDSAERALREIGSYRRGSSGESFTAFVDWIEGKLTTGSIPSHRLAEYLRPLLGRIVEHEWSDGISFTIEGRLLLPDKLASLRSRVLDLVERIGMEGDLAAAGAASDILEDVARPATGVFGKTIPDEARDLWLPEQLDAIRRLRRLQEKWRCPALDCRIFGGLNWLSQHGPQLQVKLEADQFCTELETNLVGTIEALIATNLDAGRHADWDAWRAKKESETRSKAQELLASGIGAPAAAEMLTRAHVELGAVRVHSDPGELLVRIGQNAPALAGEIVRVFADDPNHPLLTGMPNLLGGIAESDPDLCRRLIDDLASSQHPSVQRASAAVLVYPDTAPQLGVEFVLRHLDAWLRSENVGVRTTALFALQMAKKIDAAKRAARLVDYDLAAAPETGEAWAQALHFGGTFDELSHDQQESVAGKMGLLPRFEYHSEELVGRLSAVVPHAIARMLLDRVRGVPVEHDPLNRFPFHEGAKLVHGLPRDIRRDLMIELGTLLDRSPWQIDMAAKHLFHALGAGDPPLSREVMSGWVRSGDPSLVTRVAVGLREEQPEFLFQEREFIVEIIRAAARCGVDTLRDVRSELECIAFNGVRSGTPGQPTPRDLALRDAAQQAAAQYDQGSPERDFYNALAVFMEENAEAVVRRFRERAL